MSKTPINFLQIIDGVRDERPKGASESYQSGWTAALTLVLLRYIEAKDDVATETTEGI